MNNPIIERFAAIQNISYEEAEKMIGGETDEQILNNITKFTSEKINNSDIKLNRKQRRLLQKRLGKQKEQEKLNIEAISDTARKLNYIDLIQKLRELNDKKEINNNEDTTKDN